MSSSIQNESRDAVLHVPNLFEFFCQRTAEDFSQNSDSGDAPTISFASLILSFLLAMAFFIFGKPQLAKATFGVFGLLVVWTVWGVVVRSNAQAGQKADDIRSGAFPAESAPYILSRLKWWNHLVSPMRWAKHSRIFDRRGKLERKIADIQKKIDSLNTNNQYSPPTEEEVVEVANSIVNFAARKSYESQIDEISDPLAQARAEMLLHMALLHKLMEMEDKLNRIEKMAVVFQNFSASDIAQVVSESLQVLEERRILVLQVDKVDPDSFIDLVTVRAE